MRCFWKALVCANLLWVAFAAPAHAADFTWTGNTDDVWNTNGNWTLADFPDAGDNVFFQGPSANTTLELNGSRSVLSASFADVTPYTLNPGGSFTLTLVTGDLTATGTATHTINSNVAQGANGDWIIDNPLFDVSASGFVVDLNGNRAGNVRELETS